MRLFILLPLILALVGCGSQSSSILVVIENQGRLPLVDVKVFGLGADAIKIGDIQGGNRVTAKYRAFNEGDLLLSKKSTNRSSDGYKVGYISPPLQYTCTIVFKDDDHHFKCLAKVSQ